MLLEVSLALQKTATADGRDAGLRSSALEVLSLLTFAAQEDEAETRKVMSGLLVMAGTLGISLTPPPLSFFPIETTLKEPLPPDDLTWLSVDCLRKFPIGLVLASAATTTLHAQGLWMHNQV